MKKDLVKKVKAKLAIEISESKKIYEKIKRVPKGDKRDQALLKEVEDRNLSDEDVKELMYDLTHSLNMLNIKMPKVKSVKIDHELIADIISKSFDDKLFKVEMSGGYSDREEPHLEFDEISVKFDDLYKDVRKKNKDKMPESLADKDKKEIAELINSEITDLTIEDVKLERFLNEDDSEFVDMDVLLRSLEIEDGIYLNGKINFNTKNVTYFAKVK